MGETGLSVGAGVCVRVGTAPAMPTDGLASRNDGLFEADGSACTGTAVTIVLFSETA